MKEDIFHDKELSQVLTDICRPFASGSRQAPDPYDQFLDDHGFYRKHTARDSTSLFRAVSEQVYNIQNYHERVRAECVEFMTNNRHLFEQSVNELGLSYDQYLIDISKPKSRGGRLELRAMAYLYHCNVVIFEPYTTGKWFFKQRKDFTRTIRVFYSAPSHYDTIYSKAYIQKVAFCQAVVYEILYEKVFKLPDVQYAVERMLHDPIGKTMQLVKGKFGDKALTSDGREFIFDKASGTNCVLGDHKLCHFHNNDGFKSEIEKHKGINGSNTTPTSYLIESDILKSSLCLDYFLHDKNISCVRQLLDEGITPFPYKVAKAMDPSIYRNIEFDSWNDHRREQKYKNWYFGGPNLLVGCKALLKVDCGYFICHIQEISTDKQNCLVFVEGTGEKITVPFANLKALPVQYSSWGAPGKYWRHNNNSGNNSNSRHINFKAYRSHEFSSKFINGLLRYKDKYSSSIYASQGKVFTAAKCDLEIDRFTSFENFQPYPQEIIAMPILNEQDNMLKFADPKKTTDSVEEKKELKTENEEGQDPGHDTAVTFDSAYNSFYGGATTANTNTHDISTTSGFEYDGQATYTPSLPYYQTATVPGFYSYTAPPPSTPATAFNYQSYGPRPPIFSGAIQQTGFPNAAIPAGYGNTRNARATRGVNYNASESQSPDGSDLPYHDVSTLRFFFNEGVKSFNNTKLINRVASQVSTMADADSPSGSQHLQTEINQLGTALENNLKLNTTEDTRATTPFNSGNKNSEMGGTPVNDNRRDYSGMNSTERRYNNRDKRRGGGRGGTHHGNGRNNYMHNSRYYENSNRSGGYGGGHDHRNDNFKHSNTGGNSPYAQQSNNPGDAGQGNDLGSSGNQCGPPMSAGGGYLQSATTYNQNMYPPIYSGAENEQPSFFMPQTYMPAPAPYSIYPPYPIASAATSPSSVSTVNTFVMPVSADTNVANEGVIEPTVYHPYVPPLVYGPGQPQMGYFYYPPPTTYLPPPTVPQTQMLPVAGQYSSGHNQPQGTSPSQ